MTSDSDDVGIMRELAKTEDFAGLKSIVETYVRRAKGDFERAQELNNDAVERQTRAAQKEEDTQQTDAELKAERVRRMREDIRDKAETNRTIAVRAELISERVKIAERAAAKAEPVAKTEAEQAEMAELRALVQQARETAKEAFILADKTKLAADAVESIGKLAAFDFIEDQRELIFERLEECDAIAKESGGTTLFVAQSLPIINGIIYVGSRSQDNLNQAIDWVKSRFGRADPQIVLSTLVFRYIADIGLAAYKGTKSTNDTGEPREDIWARISERVEKLRIK
jgi:hypothetical protein